MTLLSMHLAIGDLFPILRMYWMKQYRIPTIADTMLALSKRFYNPRFLPTH